MDKQTARFTIMGSAASIPTPHHDTASVLLDTGSTKLLIDCGGSPAARLKLAGVDFMDLDGLIVTHHHPDHIYGVPILLMDIWLMGRRDSFPAYGPAKTLEVIKAMMDLYEWDTWPNFTHIDFCPLPLEPNTLVVSDDLVEVTSWPVEHLVPAIGVRIANKQTGGVLAYTSDTTRHPHVVDLARDADILIHEATGDYFGHSTATDAALDANEAGAKRLVLTHYPVVRGNPHETLKEAQGVFEGPVELAEDFGVYEF
jgi:ribonuclease Z